MYQGTNGACVYRHNEDKMFETSVPRIMKQDENSHHL